MNGKYKSAEIIDDSDDSAEGGGEQEEEGEGEDEFASLLREGLEGKEEEAADESEDEFESESGEEDLAGSKPVSRSQGAREFVIWCLGRVLMLFSNDGWGI